MKDVETWIERLRSCEALGEGEVKQLCARATEIFVEEGNVQRVDAPVTLCGDIHGQVRRPRRRWSTKDKRAPAREAREGRMRVEGVLTRKTATDGTHEVLRPRGAVPRGR